VARTACRNDTHEREPLLDTNLDATEARRHEPKAGADLGERPRQAVRLRTAGEQNQCFEQRCLKRSPPAQARELAQRRNATPAQPAMSATQSTRLQTTRAQPPPTLAKHSLENLTRLPAASGRTARLSDGEDTNRLLPCAYADVRAA